MTHVLRPRSPGRATAVAARRGIVRCPGETLATLATAARGGRDQRQ